MVAICTICSRRTSARAEVPQRFPIYLAQLGYAGQEFAHPSCVIRVKNQATRIALRASLPDPFHRTLQRSDI